VLRENESCHLTLPAPSPKQYIGAVGLYCNREEGLTSSHSFCLVICSFHLLRFVKMNPVTSPCPHPPKKIT
jgi:hypothetical protein